MVIEEALKSGRIPLLHAYLTTKLKAEDRVDMHEFVLCKGVNVALGYLKSRNIGQARCILYNMVRRPYLFQPQAWCQLNFRFRV